MRRERGGEARGKTKVGVRELEGSKGGGKRGVVEGVGMREGGMEVENGGENEGGGTEGRREVRRKGGSPSEAG